MAKRIAPENLVLPHEHVPSMREVVGLDMLGRIGGWLACEVESF